MEKFFTINPDSELYKDYWNWRNNVQENNEIVVKFFRENGISATQYFLSKEYLGIVPVDDDREKFKNQFRTLATNDGLRMFKKNSTIGKAWLKQAATMKFLHRPTPAFYNNCCVGQSRSRFFEYNNILYFSIDAEKVEMPDSIFTEIKGSEFHKVMEEIENGKVS